jgi:hypothetical protein
MVTVCWAAKGGSGTTVVAATLALRAERPALLVDLDGELPAVLGISEPDRPGVADWMASDAPSEHLVDLLVELDAKTLLLPYRLGHRPPYRPMHDEGRLHDALAWLRGWEDTQSGHVVIDAGTGDPPEALLAAERNLLITRNCYLGVSRASRCKHPPGGIVLIEEPGRSLTVRDIELAVGAPIVTRLSWETDIARAVDAGLLRGRLPKVIDRAFKRSAA